MSTLQEGQAVEVRTDYRATPPNTEEWCKAKINGRAWFGTKPGKYYVEFPDGTQGAFDAEHIRIDTPRGHAAIHPMEAER